MRAAAHNCLAIGFFDGVHLGHQAILRGATAALTFRNHPLTVLVPERAPRLIMSPDERLDAIRSCGVPDVTALEFTPAFAAKPPEEFLAFLADMFGGSLPAIRCGANWRFGRGGAGDADWLRAHGLAVAVAPFADYAGERISSSRIRACLERGAIADANAMMGRCFAVRGCVFRGKGLGTQLGYPTVNVRLAAAPSSGGGFAPAHPVRLPLGVYEVGLEGRRGIANYGLAPTLRDRAWSEPVLEVHFPQAPDPGFLVADRITVEFLRFIRPERTFATVGDLRRQIASDCAIIGA